MRGVVLALAAVAATASKVTIDDQDPRWTYSSNWGAFSKTAPCAGCQVKPDPDRLFAGTWHDSSSDVTATLSVDAATAISVFTVCPGPLSGGGFYHLNVSFELDDAPFGEYVEKPTGCGSIQYNYQIFSKTGLKLGPHKLTIKNRLPSPQEQTSDLIIDYAVIEDDTSSGSGDGTPNPTASQPNPTQTSQGQTRVDSSSGSSVPVAAIVVPILAVIALVAAVGFWWWRRRRQRAINVDSLVATPYHDAEPGMHSTSNNAASSEVTHSYAPGPGTASLYSASAPTHTQDADSSVLFIGRAEQQQHDPQLEAALAIIADRAGRTQNPDAVSPAVAQSRRPEKAVYRPMPSVSTTGPSTSSTITTSDARGGYMSPNEPAPPSYMDTVTR
ncbi:hypothetical protein AURDEDRAFT_178967 [Auricularia subglabra TFB-10046 SS5]|nr:hypothetical protein AURDEDRAFT_178967 [Auricularia subglabra TFB-10046 SS5]